MLLLFTACAKPPEPAARAPVRQLVMPLLEASDDDMFGCQSAADCVGRATAPNSRRSGCRHRSRPGGFQSSPAPRPTALHRRSRRAAPVVRASQETPHRPAGAGLPAPVSTSTSGTARWTSTSRAAPSPRHESACCSAVTKVSCVRSSASEASCVSRVRSRNTAGRCAHDFRRRRVLPSGACLHLAVAQTVLHGSGSYLLHATCGPLRINSVSPKGERVGERGSRRRQGVGTPTALRAKCA